MRLNDERMARMRAEAQEKTIRRIVREEIAAAFQVLGRATAYEVYGTESEIAERALYAFENVAESTVLRLTCPHEKYQDWGFGRQPQCARCARCGEPEPEPVNPFEAPLNPDCNHAFAQDDEGVRTCQICGGVKTDGTS